MKKKAGQLDRHNHDRDAAGMTYVYPVVSRRAGGVSVGINLNPNHACNWHCAYCQVPDLKRGSAPEIDIELLSGELEQMLDDLLHGPFMQDRVPEGERRLCDVAISGNGEPTSCRDFAAVVQSIVAAMRKHHLELPLRLITNGSYMGKEHVQQGLRLMADNHGEVWIKVDAVTAEAVQRINGVTLDVTRLFEQVATAAGLCPSWIQTCMLAWDGAVPAAAEVQAYLDFLVRLKTEEVPLTGVLLYGLARPSLQPEAKHVSALSADWMQKMKEDIERTGWPVKLSL
ncbi:MAG: radical SAM protein [Mariprofundaceae bacterium]